MELNDCAWSSTCVIRFVNEIVAVVITVIIVVVVVVVVVVVNCKEGFANYSKPAGRRVSGTESPPTFLPSGAEMWESQLIFYHQIIVHAF